MAGRSPLRSGTRDALVSNLDAPDTAQYQADSAGAFGRGVNKGLLGISAGSYGEEANAAELAGDPAAASSLRARALELQGQAQQYGPTVNSVADVNSLGDAAEYAMGGIGSGVATMAPTLAGAALAIGTRGRIRAPVAYTGAAVPGYLMERNEQALSQAGDPLQMAQSAEMRRQAMRTKGLVGGALETLVPAGIGATIGKATGKGLARTIGTNMLGEGATEIAQTRAGQLASQFVQQGGNLDGATVLGEDPMELVDAGILGALTGGAVSTPGAVSNVAANKLAQGADALGELGAKGLDAVKPAAEKAKDSVLGAKDRLSDELDSRFRDTDSDLLDKIVNGTNRAVESAKGMDFQSIVDKMKEFDAKRPEMIEQLRERVKTWPEAARAQMDTDNPDSMIAALREKDWQGLAQNFKDQGSRLFKGKNNLQRDINPLLQGDAQVALVSALKPEFRNMESVRASIPELAQRMIALSARTGELTDQDLMAAVQLRSTLSDIFEDPAAAAQSITDVTKGGINGLSKILEIESASTDAAKPNSFLELSMTPAKRAAGFNLKKIGRMVDELALDSEVSPRNREMLRALFGSDEKGEQVLEYYRAKIYDSAQMDAPEIDSDPDFDTDDFDARLQGINTQDLSEEAAAAPRYFFASAKTKRPFMRGEKVQATGVEDRNPKDMADRARLKLAKALAQVRKQAQSEGRAMPDVRPQIIGHGDFISKTGGDPAAEVARRIKDATKRKEDAIKKGLELAKAGKPEVQLEHERRKVREANKELQTLNMKGEDPRDVLNELYQVVEVNEVDPSGTKIDDNDVFNMGRSLRQRTTDSGKKEANESTKIDFIGPSGVAISLSAHDIARVTSQKLEKVPGVDGEGESGAQRTRRAFAEGMANLLGAGYQLKDGQDIGKAVVDRRTGLTAAVSEKAKLDETFTKTTLDSAQVENIRKMEAEYSPAEIMDKAEIAHDELRTLLSEVNPKSPRAAVLRARILAAKTAYDNALRKVFPAPEAQEAEVSQDRTEMDADYLDDIRNTMDEVREYGRRELSMSYLDSLKDQLERAEKPDARRYEEDTGLAIGAEKRRIKPVQEPSQLTAEDRQKALEQNTAADREDYRNQFMSKVDSMTPSLLVATLRGTLRRANGMGDEDLRFMMAEEVAMMLERDVAIPADLEKQAREFIKQEGVSTGPKKPPEPPKPTKSPFAPKSKRRTEGVARDPALDRSAEGSLLTNALQAAKAAFQGGAIKPSPGLIEQYKAIEALTATHEGAKKLAARIEEMRSKANLVATISALRRLTKDAAGSRLDDIQLVLAQAEEALDDLADMPEAMAHAESDRIAESGGVIPVSHDRAASETLVLRGPTTLEGAIDKVLASKAGTPAQRALLAHFRDTGAVASVKFGVEVQSAKNNRRGATSGWHSATENKVGLEITQSGYQREYVNAPLYVFLHETTHAATSLAEQHNPAIRKDLESLMAHVWDNLKTSGGDIRYYGFSNTQEFLAEAFSNREFQALLASVPALNTKTFKNAWEQFVGLVARALGIGPVLGKTALEEAMVIGLALAEANVLARKDGLRSTYYGIDYSASKLNSQGFAHPAQKWSAQDQATVLAEIARQRGPDIKAQFDDFANIGGSGSYTYNQQTGERLVKIAMQSVNPMSVAWHESLHDFMQMLTGDKSSTKMGKELLEVASSQPVIRQLRELLAGHPEALEQVETNAEERLAYAYQFFVGGQLRVGTNTKTLFGRIQAFINKLLGTVTTGDRAEAYFVNLHAGSFANGSMNPAAQIQAMQPTYADRMQKLSDMLGNVGEKLIGSTTQRLRDTNIKALGEIADKFHVDPDQEQGAALKFLQRRAMANGVWANKMLEAIEPASQDEIRTALANLQAQKAPSSTLERRIAQILDDMFAYQVKAGVKRLERVQENGKWVTKERALKKEENYFPRIWDIDAIENNGAAFIAAVDAAGGDGPKVFQAMINHRDSGKADLADPDSFTPWNQSLENRVLDFITPANAADFVQFQSRDMADILSTHVNQVIHRAEYARDFGNQGQWIEKKLEEAKNQGATPKDIKLARDAVQGLQGTLQYDMNPKLRRAMAGIITAQNLILLPLSLFSQVVDAMAIGARANSWKESMKAMDAGFKAVARSFTKNADSFTKDERLAMDLGIIDESAMLEAMGMVHHGMYLSKRMKNINRKFFKLNRMEQWNRAMRAQAVVTGQRFILANKDNARYMDELGLSASDVVETPDGGLAMDERDGLTPAQARKMRSAMFKFVDTAVLRPNAAHRPIWGNDPRFMLLMHLKQFSFTFQNTIMKNMKKELNFGNAKPLMVLMGAIPAIMMSDLAKAAMLGNIPNDMTFMSALGNGIARSGLLGTRAFGVDAGQDLAHGRLPGTSFLGPSFEHATTIAQGILQVPGTEAGDVAVRSIPGGSLVRDMIKD